MPFDDARDEAIYGDVEDMKLFGLDLKRHSRLLRHREGAYLPKANYMKWQLNLNTKMRMVLLHWLSEVVLSFFLPCALSPSFYTLFFLSLTYNNDRFAKNMNCRERHGTYQSTVSTDFYHACL